jgi:hypothetical protein
VKINNVENWWVRALFLLAGFYPWLLYIWSPFGLLSIDELGQITFHTWYAPYIYYWFSYAGLLLGLLMCLPIRTWSNYKWLILIPPLASIIIIVFRVFLILLFALAGEFYRISGSPYGYGSFGPYALAFICSFISISCFYGALVTAYFSRIFKKGKK